jgi:E3 ubiquitin-protein ligase CCNP1IP1
MQVEIGAMEEKNHELVNAFREKSKAQHHLQQLYQKLKNQCMIPQVANALGTEKQA